MREFLKKFNINMVLIFTLIGVFLGADFGYAHDVLRVPSSFQSKKGARVTRAMRALSDRRFVIQHEEFLRYLSSQQQTVLKLLYLGDKKTTQTKIAGQLEPTISFRTATGNGGHGQDESHKGVTKQDIFQLRMSGMIKLRELVDPHSDFQLVMRHRDVLSRLTENQRQVLIAFFIDGKHQSEIAKELGVSVSMVVYYSASGIRKLRKLMDPRSDFQLVMRHQELLRMLTERQRDVLTRLYADAVRETPAEIAESLHVTESVVSVAKTHGIQKLRELVITMKRSTDL